MYSKKNLKWLTLIMTISSMLLFLGLCQFIISQYHKEELNFSQNCQLVFSEAVMEFKNEIIEEQIKALNEYKRINDSLMKVGIEKNIYNSTNSDSLIFNTNHTNNSTFDNQSSNKSIFYTIKVTNQNRANNSVDEDIIWGDEIIIYYIDKPTLKRDFIKVLRRFKEEHLFDNESNIDYILSHKNTELDFTFVKISQSIKVDGEDIEAIKSILPQLIFAILVFLCVIFSFYIARKSIYNQIAMSEQKDDLMSSISHELKTPVATTKLILDAIKNFNIIDDRDKTEQYIGMAQWEINRLELMIEKTMNLLLSEKGQLHLNKEHLEINKLVSVITTMLQPLAHKNEKKILFHPSKELIYVDADKLHLNNAIYNIIDNAIKYGGNIIENIITTKGDHVMIKIKDNGTGLTKEHRHRVFDKFFRVPHGNKYSIKGHGIGLSYCKKIVELLHGKLYLNSTLETTFIIELPIIKVNEI